ncbi:CRISPR-associated endoribonuclease Cas6 [Porphyromonas circumdentaria]|uniref:CRISPR-associated endoribonuclease n=1 Tax=Porphyromonas circumdentaria TaxID=29524 RepID=A0A1T4MLV8_9PORP|nr:CRISPR-associated endoribonuclease Cas6 [Porphyromonas circumdentaria]MBB6275867.1 CRISPR-associated endoribonuclease Cas6 [Porphyromonas circumdentaria]SJZ67972.1 CRISPR-associated endoribonuclease Cas6 [Porphyromonas circumdentaria]
MRFKISLQVNKAAYGNLLPLNYQYELSAAIYKILSRSDQTYTEWLHNNGFMGIHNQKKFKLFCFSRLYPEKFRLIKESARLEILSDKVEWELSFLPENSTSKFIQGIFLNQVFEIGDKYSSVQFKVQNIEALLSPSLSSEMRFETLSPICLRMRREDLSTEYISPLHEKAREAIRYGLLNRYEAYHNKTYSGEDFFEFEPLNIPKSALIKVKANTPYETKVKGFMCRFRVKAPVDLMHILYASGVGEECSQGFGCVRIL